MPLRWNFKDKPIVKLQGHGVFGRDDGERRRLQFLVELSRGFQKSLRIKHTHLAPDLPVMFHLVDNGHSDVLISLDRWKMIPFVRQIGWEELGPMCLMGNGIDAVRPYVKKDCADYTRLDVGVANLFFRPHSDAKDAPGWPIRAIVSPDFRPNTCVLGVATLRQYGLLVHRRKQDKPGVTGFFWHEGDWAFDLNFRPRPGSGKSRPVPGLTIASDPGTPPDGGSQNLDSPPGLRLVGDQ